MSFVLGTSRRGEVRLTPEERSWHVHVLGGIGRGKSSLLESMIRQDILAGRGLCLIDPHGTLADDIVAWCASRRLNDLRRVHVDPSRTGASSGSNSSEAYSSSSHESVGETKGYSQTSGRSQTLKPVRVTMPTAVHSLEEELHLAIVKLRGLPKQAAILKRPNSFPVRFKPLDIQPPVSGKARAGEFIEAARAASPFIVRAEIAEAEMAARLAELRKQEKPPGDEEFFSEEPG